MIIYELYIAFTWFEISLCTFCSWMIRARWAICWAWDEMKSASTNKTSRDITGTVISTTETSPYKWRKGIAKIRRLCVLDDASGQWNYQMIGVQRGDYGQESPYSTCYLTPLTGERIGEQVIFQRDTVDWTPYLWGRTTRSTLNHYGKWPLWWRHSGQTMN